MTWHITDRCMAYYKPGCALPPHYASGGVFQGPSGTSKGEGAKGNLGDRGGDWVGETGMSTGSLAAAEIRAFFRFLAGRVANRN